MITMLYKLVAHLACPMKATQNMKLMPAWWFESYSLRSFVLLKIMMVLSRIYGRNVHHCMLLQTRLDCHQVFVLSSWLGRHINSSGCTYSKSYKKRNISTVVIGNMNHYSSCARKNYYGILVLFVVLQIIVLFRCQHVLNTIKYISLNLGS
jgi:hypothetical protein